MNETETITTAPSEAKPRLCQIEVVLGNTIGSLLKAHPNNPIVRAHALALLRQEIPPSLIDWESIKEWVETTITPSNELPKSSSDLNDLRVAFEVGVEFSETESGNSSYSCNRGGQGRYPIVAADLRRIVEASSSIEEVMDSLNDNIVENCQDYINIDTSDHDYDNHDATEYSDASTDYNETLLRQNVIDWMRANMPDTLDEWVE
jgi:hypothetical protein